MAKDFGAEMSKTQQERNVLGIEVNTSITNATSRKGQAPASPEEQERRKREGRTQGRLGCKADAVRVNLTLTPENHKFCKVMASIKGISITKYINECLDAYKAAHGETFAKAQELVIKELR